MFRYKSDSMPTSARVLVLIVAVSGVLAGCGGASGACVVDEERIARRVAELLEEHAAELADESGGEGDSEDDDADDDHARLAAGGGEAPEPRPVPGPSARPVPATPFSDPPSGPRAGFPAAAPQVVRPTPTEPPPRVWVPPGRSPSRGPENALVTLIVFTDFQCPFCSRVAGTVEELRGRYPDELRVVFKQFPLSMHARAMPASEASVEAFVQGGDAAFWRMHDQLFANQRALSLEDLVGHAAALGLDAGRLGAAVEAQVHAASIEADMALGTASGVTGTPTFFLNGTRLVGAVPLDVLVAAVEAELVVARAALAHGTPRARIYETIANGAPRRPRGAR